MKKNFKIIKLLKIRKYIYSKDLRESYNSASICGNNLKGKKVLITGVYGGIGSALAYRFLKEQCCVCLAGRNIDKVNQLKNELSHIFPSAEIKCIEINNLNSNNMHHKITELVNSGFCIDVLVNNSGIFTEVDKNRLFREVTRDQFNLVWETNYVGTYELTKTVCSVMNKKNRLHVINISSICSTDRKYSYTPYGMSKRALLSIHNLMKDEYPDVTFHSILPGSVATRMGNLSIGNNIAINRNKIRRTAMPEEISALTIWITSLEDTLKSELIIASACEAF